MTTPRDFHKNSHTGRIKAARLFSNIVSPPVMFAILGVAFGLYEIPNFTGFLWAAVYGLLVSLAPILVVLYFLKTGRIKELHMSDTNERHLPYISAIIFALIAFALISYFDGPELLRCLALFNAIELTALGIINVKWLISLHSTGITATFLLVGLVFGWVYALVLVLPFVFLVCYVRLYLKRHTLGQIIAGILLGFASVWLMTLMGCFV